MIRGEQGHLVVALLVELAAQIGLARHEHLLAFWCRLKVARDDRRALAVAVDEMASGWLGKVEAREQVGIRFLPWTRRRADERKVARAAALPFAEESAEVIGDDLGHVAV